ncbi:MAG: hypothetical protein GY859_36015 [Desulfobacterales bacterium]|nr:hypothetical protein [Desulfobacterales bacterium]
MGKKQKKKRGYGILIHLFIITAYIAYFFIIENRVALTIVKAGPEFTFVGEGFNKQAGKTSAMWFKTEGVENKSVVVVFGNENLPTNVEPENQVVTAAIPERCFQAAGIYKVFLLDVENNMKSNVIEFSVLEKNGGDKQTDGLIIEKFGPISTTAGKGFNAQPGGESAMWFNTRGVYNKSIVVVFGEEKVKAVVDVKRQVVTTVVPESVFASPGPVEIYLRDVDNSRDSNQVLFVVNQPSNEN